MNMLVGYCINIFLSNDGLCNCVSTKRTIYDYDTNIGKIFYAMANDDKHA